MLVAQQLRRAVPGGIGTYVRGLTKGLGELGADAPPVTSWHSWLPARATTWAWDHDLAGPPREAGAVVHATSLAVPPSGARPLTVMVHDLAWRRFPDAFPERGRRWHEAALVRALARAELLLAPSRPTADDLLEAGAAADRVEVVEEGCDHLDPPDDASAAALLERLGVRGDFVLTVSTLEPRKNLDRLMAAFASARPGLADTSLVVVGPQGWGPALVPVDGAVLAGPVTGGALTALYGRARVFAYVPRFEGFGLPPLEAMACGTPVVASPMPSTGDAAAEVDPLDIEAIADALVRMATDDEARAVAIAHGSARAGALPWRAAARRHVELWRRLL